MLRNFYSVMLLAVVICTASDSLAQCLTDFQKLASQPSPYYTENYGESIALYGDVMAVGANQSDSLGYRTGIVYLYRFINGEWENFAYLYPSGLEDYSYFGISLAMGPNYIVVGGIGLGSRLYVFKKPASGWTTMSETAVLSDVSATSMGYTLTMSEDENIIATSEDYNGAGGKVFTFVKDAVSEWSSRSTSTQILECPLGNESIRFGNAIAIHNEWMAVGQQYNNNASQLQRIWMYEFDPVTMQYTFRSTLSSTLPGSYLGNAMVLNDEGLLASQFYYDDSFYGKSVIAWFQKPTDGVWKDAEQTCVIQTIGVEYGRKLHLGMKEMNGEIIIGHTDQAGDNGYVVRWRKGASGWCDPIQEVVGQNQYRGINYTYGSSVAAHNNHVAVSFAAVPDNSFNLNGVHTLYTNGATWTEQSITNTRVGTSDHWMGEETFFYENHLFVSATNDNAVARRAGKVYIYTRNADNWQNIGALLPPVDSYTDDHFGSAFAAHEDELAVGAAGFDPGGAIFIYKNTHGWHEPELIQTITLPDTAEFDLMGYDVVMNDRWLISSIQNHSDVHKGPFAGNAVQSSIIIYEKKNGRWEYHDYMDFGNSFVFAKSTVLALDLEGDQLVVGNPYSNATGKIDGVVFLMQYNDEKKEWNVPHYLYSSDRDNLAAFGASVELDGNHLFVGAPLKDHDGKRDVGAVYVFIKPSGGWRTSSQNTVIFPTKNTERQLFGTSVKKMENILLAGAPGSDINTDGTLRNEPGEVYVIQSLDYFWTETIPLLILQGDTFTKDYFGLALDLFKDEIVVGAPIEKNNQDRPAGVAYVVPMPPLVKLEAPVCSTSGPITLFGYPFGGTWSGAGITNAASGEFDPALAGPGLHMLEYVTPNCFYTGKLRIEVKESPVATLERDPHLYLCKDNSGMTVDLKATFISGNSYFWYHRENADAPFTLINPLSSAQIAVDKTGTYYVSVDNGFCTVTSSHIQVDFEDVPVTIPPLPVICDSETKEVQLTATPSGGNWSGPLVNAESGTVNVSSMQNGIHAYEYWYTSAAGCRFSATTLLTRKALNITNVEIVGPLCAGEDVLLEVATPQDAFYSWLFRQESEDSFTAVREGNNLTEVYASQPGYYRVSISNSDCEVMTPEILVNPVRDSIFIPNFISPNGDGKNDRFTITGTVWVESVSIYNRHGKHLVTLSPTETWNGDVPSGVYFFIVHYVTCTNERVMKKGTVSVMR